MIKKDGEWDNKDGNSDYLDSQRKQTYVHACTHTYKNTDWKGRERLSFVASVCTWWCKPALTLCRSYIKRNLHMAFATHYFPRRCGSALASTWSSLHGQSCREFSTSESPPHHQSYLLAHELSMSTISWSSADSRHVAIRQQQQQQQQLLDDVMGISSSAQLHPAPSIVDRTYIMTRSN
jgi:hypothetical protein